MSDLEQWAIVELMGHQKIAGLVTELPIGGASLIRVDVPGDKPYTKCYGPNAVYCITFTDQATATAAAKAWAPRPIDTWTIRDLIDGPGPKQAEFEETDYDD